MTGAMMPSLFQGHHASGNDQATDAAELPIGPGPVSPGLRLPDASRVWSHRRSVLAGAAPGPLVLN
jgi:hypothetical protein